MNLIILGVHIRRLKFLTNNLPLYHNEPLVINTTITTLLHNNEIIHPHTWHTNDVTLHTTKIKIQQCTELINSIHYDYIIIIYERNGRWNKTTYILVIELTKIKTHSTTSHFTSEYIPTILSFLPHYKEHTFILGNDKIHIGNLFPLILDMIMTTNHLITTPTWSQLTWWQ